LTPEARAGAEFTCFARTRVQILTPEARAERARVQQEVGASQSRERGGLEEELLQQLLQLPPAASQRCYRCRYIYYICI
jgi:hypothetical protein